MEAVILTETFEAVADAQIAARQAAIRQGLDKTTVLTTCIADPNTRQLRWTFSTAGVSREEHDARLNELKELGQFND